MSGKDNVKDLREIANNLHDINKKLGKKESGLSKNDYLFILALGLGILFVLSWQFGLYSANVVTKNIANETKDETENQTKLIISHFDEQFRHDLREEILQKELLHHQNTTLNNQVEILNRMDHAIKQNQYTIEQNTNITNQNYNISKQHQKVAEDHQMIQHQQGKTGNDTLLMLQTHHQHIEDTTDLVKYMIELLGGNVTDILEKAKHDKDPSIDEILKRNQR